MSLVCYNGLILYINNDNKYLSIKYIYFYKLFIYFIIIYSSFIFFHFLFLIFSIYYHGCSLRELLEQILMEFKCSGLQTLDNDLWLDGKLRLL